VRFFSGAFRAPVPTPDMAKIHRSARSLQCNRLSRNLSGHARGLAHTRKSGRWIVNLGPPSKAFCQSQEIEIKAELAIFPRKRVSVKTPQPISVRALPVSAKGLLGVNILVLQAPIRTRSVIRIDTIADRLPLLRLPLLCHLRLFFFSCKTLPAEAL